MNRVVLGVLAWGGLLCGAAALPAQDTLRLAELQDAAMGADARLRQLQIEESRTALRLRNLAVERLPQLGAAGEAAYQSEVPSIPLEVPGMTIPEPPRSRVDAAVSADLLLWDGGAIGARRAAERARLAVAGAELASVLYPLRTEVSQAYFGALLLQERAREADLLIEELEARLDQVREQYRAGAALAGDTAALRAEVLEAEQRRAEMVSERSAALVVLSELTGLEVSEEDVLTLPVLDEEVERARGAAASLRRHPQYEVFQARRDALERQQAVLTSRLRPRASAFGRLAYGRPGLQQFSDDLHQYWLAGVRVQWSPWDWGVEARERELLELERQALDTEEAAFTDRLERQVALPLAAIDRLRAALGTDERIVSLREQVARQARVQFEERAITAAEYVDALAELEAARAARVRHRVELEQARADFLITLGLELR